MMIPLFQPRELERLKRQRKEVFAYVCVCVRGCVGRCVCIRGGGGGEVRGASEGIQTNRPRHTL